MAAYGLNKGETDLPIDNAPTILRRMLAGERLIKGRSPDGRVMAALMRPGARVHPRAVADLESGGYVIRVPLGALNGVSFWDMRLTPRGRALAEKAKMFADILKER